jgi:hypothetical protein
MTHSTKPLSALALTQLRLDVEAAVTEAGRSTREPLDHEFFDPLMIDDERLEDEMSQLGLLDQFHEMRKRAQERFPQPKVQEGTGAQWFADRYRSQNWLGMKGVLAHAATWLDAQQLDETEFDEFAAAVDLPKGSAARAMIDVLAQRHSKARSMGLSSYSYWSQFAVAMLFSEERFELMVSVADDMSLMFADELVEALHAEPLDARMNRKAESGGAPSVFYQAKITALPDNSALIQSAAEK